MSETNHARLVSTAEIAYLLNIGESTVRRLAAQEKLPAFRVGRQYRFNPDELIGWRVTPVRSQRERKP